jgi:hypothetical protein
VRMISRTVGKLAKFTSKVNAPQPRSLAFF